MTHTTSTDAQSRFAGVRYEKITQAAAFLATDEALVDAPPPYNSEGRICSLLSDKPHHIRRPDNEPAVIHAHVRILGMLIGAFVDDSEEPD